MSISDVFDPICLNSILKQTKVKNELFSSDQTIQTKTNTINGEIDVKSSSSSSSHLEHIIFLDWDDTLMPTTYLLSNIDYEINEKNKKIKTFSINGKSNELKVKQFIANLEKAGNATFELLTKICCKFKAENIKIITNGINGWLPESLFVAGTFCKIYKKIKHIIHQYDIQIIYARNSNLNQIYWKTKCFDQLLWQYFNAEKLKKNQNQNININIITIGDQWTDHKSIHQSLSYHIYGDLISHHQIKLYSNPDCRYLCIELKYISDLLDQEILFKFNNFINRNIEDQQGLVLEFDGYNDNDSDN